MTHELEIILGIDCFVCVEMGLELDMDESRSMINKDATTGKHFTVTCLATGCKQPSFHAADEVINRDTTSWEQVVLLEGSLPVMDEGTLLAGGWTMMLFAIETSSASWEILELADSSVEVMGLLGVSQNTSAHYELHFPESQVTKMVMPAKKFLLVFRKVDVRTAYNGNSQR